MAAAVDVHSRFADEEYKNWLKVGQALLCLRDGLCSFTGSLSEQLQKQVLQKCGVGAKSCNKCTAKDIEYKKVNNECWALKNPCPVDLCDKLLIEVANQHTCMKAKQMVYWSNTNVTKWTTEHWEIAKVFMGKGQKADNQAPDNTDASNLLILLKQCKHFKPHLKNNKHIDKVLQYRNQLMHSSTLRVTDSDLKSALAGMIEVLEDPQGLKENPEAKKAVENIKEIEVMVIDLGADSSTWRDREVHLVREKMRAVEDRLCDLEEGRDKMQEKKELQEMFETFLQENKDLQPALSPDLQNAFGHLDKRVSDIEKKVSQLRIVTSATHNTSVVTADSDFNINGNYKGALSHFAQKNKMAHPKYEKLTDPLEPGVGAKVTYGGMVYKSEKNFKKGSIAEENAAFQALKQLGEIQDTGSGSNLQTADITRPSLTSTLQAPQSSMSATQTPMSTGARPKTTLARPETPAEKELNGLLCRLGFQKFSVTLMPHGQKVKVNLKVKVTHCVGLTESVPGKKNAEQQVAKMILEILSVLDTDKTAKSPKEQLHSYCGKLGLRQANYFTCEDKSGKTQHFWAYAAIECLTGGERDVCVMGSESESETRSESETESVSSAAECMVKILEGVKLAEVVGSHGNAKMNNSNQQAIVSQSDMSVNISRRQNDTSATASTFLNAITSNTSPKQAPKPQDNGQTSLSQNYVSKLNEFCQRKRQEVPKFEIEERAGTSNAKEYRGIVRNHEHKVTIDCGDPMKKKDAEKKVALHALSTIFHKENVDLTASKNQLQEVCVKIDTKNIPIYKVAEGRAEVTFQGHIEGTAWFPDKKIAKTDIAKVILTVLESGVH